MCELSLIRYPILNAVPHCFTTRTGGVSKGAQASLNMSFSREASGETVLENYRRVAAALGVDFTKMTHVPQCHGDRILTVTERETGIGITKPDLPETEVSGYDAMITDVPGTVLCTLHADCVPVLFYDARTNAVGAVHSGWRGTALRIAEKTVRQMKACYGTRPEQLKAVIGPSIGMLHFETDRDVYDAMQEAFGDLTEEKRLVCRENEKYHISVSGFVYRTLLDAGLLPDNITYDQHCTYTEETRFFSHRRDKGNTGAMAAVIAARSDL